MVREWEEKKEDPKMLQEIIGNSKISTTYDTYVKVRTKTKARALEGLEKVLTGKS